MIDLELCNRRYAGIEFLSGPTSESVYSHLVAEITNLRERLGCTGPEFTPPDIVEPYAWRRGWIILKGLRQRERMPRNPQVVADEVAAFNSAKDWNAYLEERTKLIALHQRSMIKNDDLQYLGLLPGDLGPPTVKGEEAMRFGGRRPDWQEIASRISHAIARWEGMSKDEKNTIPGLMAARRAEAEIIALKKRMVLIEATMANMLKPEAVSPIVDEHSAA